MVFDIAIIGAGPAGMTAALYAKRAGLNIIIFEKSFPGGQMVFTNSIENYPGFDSISGSELAMTMKKQIDEADFRTSEITDVDFSGNIKIIKTKNEEIQSKAVVIATGAVNRRLEAENENKFFARGVSYCATCDGAFYRNKNTAVIGGGNTALDDALYLANFCESVSLIHRREEFRGDKITLDKIRGNPKIKIYTNSILLGILGDKTVSGIEIENVITREKTTIEVDGVFGAIGFMPNTVFLKDKVSLSGSNAVITDENMKTSVDNVYAVGDVREKNLKQIITACNDGAIAVDMIRKYI